MVLSGELYTPFTVKEVNPPESPRPPQLQICLVSIYITDFVVLQSTAFSQSVQLLDWDKYSL